MCNTLGEITQGLEILMQHCLEYGVILPDPLAMPAKRQSKPVKRLSASSRSSKRGRYSLTPVKPIRSRSGRLGGMNSPGGVAPMKKKSRKTMGKRGDNDHFNAFGFYPNDRPVRGARRNISYAE